ncbi:diguanylate cyclase [Pigmentiphaga aceris]|uniref:Diguanylate cyclase n=1 Tax=Pigmentiphaga aceris TaxID=1940612 RepID=A0A5C0AZ49_9BURK|nr:sensor domain-containing diguanylate cyclase [Pigmentiphaga aceris]QEI07709.1 diguanylate cyclase [Pigmentiphaga aceris]
MKTRLHELHRISLVRHPDYASLYRDHLDTGKRLLGMPTGVIARIEGVTYRILAVSSPLENLQPDQIYPLANVFCEQVIRERRTVAHHNIGGDPTTNQYQVYKDTGLERYLGAPLWVNDQIYGTLSFSDTVPQAEPFSADDLEFLELQALALGRAIERDLQDQQRALIEQRLNEQIALFESAFHSAAIGMALVAREGRWLKVNRAMCDMLGYTEDELLEIDFQRVTHPDDLGKDLAQFNELVEGRRNAYQLEKRYLHKSGSVVWALLYVSMIRDRTGNLNYFVSQVQDITERKQTEAELLAHRSQLQIANISLRALASVDQLTGLGNRRAFNRQLEDAIADAQRSRHPLSLLMVDVDRFKQYNDDFGHPAGDSALRAVARCLSRSSRAGDFVARYGGEEFVVLLPDTNREEAMEVAERLRSSVAQITTEKRAITASVGVSTRLPTDPGIDADLVRLISSADVALYRAKSNGRNQVVADE